MFFNAYVNYIIYDEAPSRLFWLWTSAAKQFHIQWIVHPPKIYLLSFAHSNIVPNLNAVICLVQNSSRMIWKMMHEWTSMKKTTVIVLNHVFVCFLFYHFYASWESYHIYCNIVMHPNQPLTHIYLFICLIFPVFIRLNCAGKNQESSSGFLSEKKNLILAN